MSVTDTPRLPATFNRLAWSNLAAQSAEQIALAAAPIVAVLMLGVGEGATGLLQTPQTLPFIVFATAVYAHGRSAARGRADGHPGADLARRPDAGPARAFRFRRGVRHGGLQ